VDLMQITESLIKKYTDEGVFKKGEELYRYGKVTDLHVAAENSKYFNFKAYKLEGWVNTSNQDEYNVEVTFNDRSGFMNVKCDCESILETYRTKGFCHHVVAVLLKYAKENMTPGARNLNSTRVDRLLRELKNSMMKATEMKRVVNMEVRYFYDKIGQLTSGIELRLGFDRYYIVKNIKEFLSAIETGEEIEFGKGFTYIPAEHKFKDEDKKIIELLQENYEIEAKSNNPGGFYYYGVKMFSGKKAFLLDKQLNRFFNLVKGRYIEATIQGVDYSDVMVFEEDMPLDFQLKMEADKIVLLHNSDMPRPLSSNGRYYFYKGNIFMPSNTQLKIYVPFYNAFMSERSYHISFNKDDGDKIASYIVPSLKKISNKIELDKNLESDFYEEILKVKLYLDKEDDGASAAIVFNYGDIDIDGIQEERIKNARGILIRDIDTELGMYTLLESYGFIRNKDKYVINDEAKLVSFLREGLARLQESCEVYYSEGFKNIKLYTSSSYKSSVRLNEGNLLEFSFRIEGVDNEELKNIFRALREKRKYYKLKRGGFVSLEEEELKQISDIIEYLDIKDSELLNDKIILSKYNALYIDQSIRQNNMEYVQRNKNFRELINNIRDMDEMDFQIPEHLDKVMRNYQKIGFNWFKTLSNYGFGGILADEMGLGKTLQTIAFIASERGTKPSLVVAPTSLVYNWKSEIEKFAPELKTLVISGNRAERDELRKDMEACDIVVTSYPLIRRDIEEYKSIEFKYCILDEAQQIKNPASMNATSVKEIKANGYFALTGTPIENSLTELWSIFDFIMPGYLMNHHRFYQKYEGPIAKDKDSKAVEQLNRHIKPFILRRLKKDVIKELPPKIEQKLVVEMSEEQKKLYAAYLTEAKNQIDQEIRNSSFSKSKLKILAVLTRLRQICCDPTVFVDNFQGESGKMLALDEILQDTIGEGHRVLLFSQFTSVLKNIGKRLDNNGIEYMYLDGSTKAEDRGKMVKEFNDGKSGIFLISLKAGGTGLNLTGADIVIHFDPWWNPAVEDQATDRAHRIGQNKTVEVIKLIAQGTIEEKIINLQEKKKEIISNVMGDDVNENNIISKMTQEEIEELFRID
jgi:SNF2 family DNA or RNA helicase